VVQSHIVAQLDSCGQSLATNALKHFMDRLKERILQTDQLKNASKRLQHSVDRILSLFLSALLIIRIHIAYGIRHTTSDIQ